MFNHLTKTEAKTKPIENEQKQNNKEKNHQTLGVNEKRQTEKHIVGISGFDSRGER